MKPIGTGSAIFACLACLIGFIGSTAQAGPWSFQWQKGQVLSYKVEHITTVTEVLAGNNTEMTSRLNLVKRWQVEAVDQGIATVRLTLAAMRNEQTRPNGEVLLFDSANPDTGTPELRAQLTKFIGKTLAVLRVDQHGKVIEVVQGSAAQFETDPPFVLRLPADELKEGQTWQRLYQIALNPPFGTGEKYQAIQQYQVMKLANGHATMSLSTTIKELPKSPAEQLPLLQKQPQGEIVFDIASGKVRQARLNIDREIRGHQGEGSSYHFVSRYTEQLVE